MMLGFCDIHHFEYCTQQLGNDVLTFTNAIAEIVHSNVHSWRGACNKNLGNAFVLLWRIGDEEELLASYGGENYTRHRPILITHSTHTPCHFLSTSFHLPLPYLPLHALSQAVVVIWSREPLSPNRWCR